MRFRLGEAYLANDDMHNARFQFHEAAKLEISEKKYQQAGQRLPILIKTIHWNYAPCGN